MTRKKKLRISTSRRRQLRRFKKPLLIALVGFVLGVGAVKLWQNLESPSNLVWAADSSVHIPGDLKRFLLDYDNDCEAYRGSDSPDGIGLWGVYQVSKGQYAKIAYGCSWALSNYIMAVKHDGSWRLIQPAEYFAPFKNGVDPTQGALPFCSVVGQYKIPGEIEPFCILPDGSAHANTQT